MAHTHVRITKNAHGKPAGTGENIHYKPGDIHEIGSDTMSETLANQLMGDGYAEPYEYEGLDDTVAQVGDFGGPVAAASAQQPNEASVPPAVIEPRKAVKEENEGKGAKKKEKEADEPEKHHGRHGSKHEDASPRHTGAYSGETSGVSGTGSTSGTPGSSGLSSGHSSGKTDRSNDTPDSWGGFSEPESNP